jgi:hypothetical protein
MGLFDLGSIFSGGISNLLGGAGGVGGLLGGGNPLTNIFESVGKQLGIPDEILHVGELAAGIYTGNIPLALQGASGLFQDLSKNPPAQTEYCPPKQGCGGYCDDGPSKADLEHRDALVTLNKHFDKFDGFNFGPFSFGKDGLITQDELRRLIDNPNTPADVKKAANYFLEHPEHFNTLEQSAGIGGKDGLVGKLDVNAELAKLNEKIAAKGEGSSGPDRCGTQSPGIAEGGCVPPPPYQCGNDDELAREIKKLLANKNLPMEAKIMAFATAMASKLDKAIDQQMKKVEGLADKQTKGFAEGASDKAKGEAQGASGSLQIEMQKLNMIMGLEKTLLEVASNAIQNYNQINGKIAGNSRV